MEDRPQTAAATPILPAPEAPLTKRTDPQTKWPSLGQKRTGGPKLGVLFFIFGVILPTFTLGFELFTHSCAEALFDPIPTWMHAAFVALVPLCNLLIGICALRRQCARPSLLLHANAAAFAVALVYAVLFLPFTPFAVIGVWFIGFGLLPLAPLISVFTTWRARRALRSFFERDEITPSPWCPALAALAALGFPIAWSIVTDEWSQASAHGAVHEQTRAIQRLRTWGHRDTLLTRCYREPRWAWAIFENSTFRRGGSMSSGDAQKVFYRVTGKAYNSQPAPASISPTGQRGFRAWNFDNALGGERVADKVAGLTLESSVLDGKIDPAGLTSYAEWTLIFKNIARRQSEARVQIQLPPGGVVSRLTLWIDGEPHEAAFGGRAQVRKAYQEVAVQQRRDPVLVTTCGPDRILVQCFPVPPDGGEMKIRVGITSPLRVLNEANATLILPRMIETNFEPARALAHDVRIEIHDATGSIIRQRLKDTELQQPRSIPVKRRAAANEVWTDDASDPAFVIRQIVQAQTAALPTRLAVVLDGSEAMRSHWKAINAALQPWIEGPQQPAALSVHFAGDAAETWQGSPGISDWLRQRRPRGGCDNLPALLDAWDFAAREPGGVIVWIHGPQPVQLSRTEPLQHRIDRDKNTPLIYDLPVAGGPTRLLEDLANYRGWHRADLEATPQQSLERLLARLLGQGAQFVIQRERIPKSVALLPENKTDRHLARLWGLEEIDRLRAAPASLEQAVKLALQLQLVTPVSGAVVLERQEQYERHGLTPASTGTVPSVPEPSTVLLLGAGALIAGLRRPPRKGKL